MNVMDVLKWDPATDGAFTEQALRRKLEARGYLVAAYLYPPGTRFGLHTHAVDKIDAVVSGRFRITMGKDSVVLGPGDAVRVPRGVEHSAEMGGEEEVLSLDAIRE